MTFAARPQPRKTVSLDHALSFCGAHIARLDPDEKRVIKEVVESILIKHDAKRWIKGEHAA